jgi:hypothetical protein
MSDDFTPPFEIDLPEVGPERPYDRHHGEDDVTYARRLTKQAEQMMERAQKIARDAAKDAARDIVHEREGAPVVTIGLDTPVTRIPRYSGDPDDEPEDATTLRDLIIERAAAQLSHASRDVTEKVRARAIEMVEEGMRERVAALIEDTLTNPIRQTNTWGEPTGEPTTLRSLIIKEGQSWLVRPIPRDGSGGRYNRDDATKASAAVLIRDTVDSVMSRELADQVAAAKQMVKERVQTTSAAVIGKAVSDGLALNGR